MKYIDNIIGSNKLDLFPFWIIPGLIIASYIGIILKNYLLPLLKFYYERKREQKDEDRKIFSEADKVIEDLEKITKKFLKCLDKLQNDIKSNKVEKPFLLEFVSLSTIFFNHIISICDKVEKGFITKTSNIVDLINIMVKHKYNKKDNFIIDTYKALKKGCKNLSIDIEPLRNDKYDVIYRVYKSNFPLYKRCIGFFYKGVFDIN